MKDIFSLYKSDELWSIKERGFVDSLQNVRESQLSLGNGFLGSRGVLEEIPHNARPGTFIAGVYDKMTAQVAEMVNLPNPFCFKCVVNGEKLGAVAMDILSHERVLNMRDGLLLRRTVYSDSKKRRYDYQSIRFVSMQNKNIGAMQIALTALDDNASIEVQTTVDTYVYNSGVLTEGNKRHFRVREISRSNNIGFSSVQTLEKTSSVLYHSGLYYRAGGKKINPPDNVFELKLKKGQTVILTKIFDMALSEYEQGQYEKNKELAGKRFKKAFKSGFTNILKRHITAWRALWDTADVVIEGTADIQKNLRFNIYHMLICAHFDNGFSSIGARTLSGEGYRGHIFWDAEIFLLPFYAYVIPEVAKNMLLYRYNRLGEARKIAKANGYKGVMFPWESAGFGDEEAPQWAKNLDGTIIKIKTDKLEHHITADIAYACYKYVTATGDQEFMKEYGYEIIFESARFWASRVKRNKKRRFEIRDVIGPDEFHERVNNNAFTNIMAKWNMMTAFQLFNKIKTRDKKTYKRLVKALNLTNKEVSKWKHIALWMKINIRKDRVIEQFDGFFRKQYIKIVEYDENLIPLLPKNVKVKDFNKTQFVKQADVLMLMYLLPYAFSHKTKVENFNYYVERTLHKSSLSASIHSIMALEAGSLSRAYQFFNAALRADISNLHNNTHEGIHAACLGGTWQAAVNGFGGIRVRERTLSINPSLPQSWHKIKCNILWLGYFVKIGIKTNKITITVQSKLKKRLKVEIFGRSRVVRTNTKYIFYKTKPVRRKPAYY